MSAIKAKLDRLLGIQFLRYHIDKMEQEIKGMNAEIMDTKQAWGITEKEIRTC